MTEREDLLAVQCQGQALRRVQIDLVQGSLSLVLERGTLTCCEVRSSNWMGPWDGTLGRISTLRIQRVEPLLFLECRIEYPEVPRHYRVVCREVDWCVAGPEADESTS